jgi:transcription elongation factor GreA
MEEKQNKVVVTREGLAELQAEYDRLVHVEREQVIEELQAARAQGDLSENADYDAARDRQARVEGRIAELDAMLKNIELIDDEKAKKGTGRRRATVILGSVVTLEYLDSGEKETYTIVGTVEADPFNGKLSNETPLAAAILNHKVNDVCPVLVDEPYEVKILEIR